MRRFIIILLCLCLAVVPFSVNADDSESELIISTAEELLEFAENCRLDSYSKNIIVKLTADIDIDGTDFMPIPIFSGVFNGGGHTISGLSVNCEGSVQGMFRYLTDTAVVKDLNVCGTVEPQGSRNTVGGIAGSNSGRILSCTFTGSVSGADYVGGIAGVNTASGVISNCRTEGTACGNHFVGGIAGENNGQILDCKNHAQINNTPHQNSVEISEITIDTLTGSEYAATVTDVGGITGANTGAIKECANHAVVGYKHMGYNIGGIAGSSVGYIYKCSNTGNISGRKDVGGIAGQIKPAALMEYSADTIEILEHQFNAMQYLTNAAAQNAQESTEEIGAQLDVLQTQSQAAQNALGIIIQNMENPDEMNFDAIQSAYNAFSSSIDDMGATMQVIGESAESSMEVLGGNLQSINEQMNAIGATIDNAEETSGVSIQDVSDRDTALDISAKTERCSNVGSVVADLNAGGIAGIISIENNIDHEADIAFEGEISTNLSTKLRAVILSCENSGSVYAKREGVGGIAGSMLLGLTKKCVNTGDVGSDTASHVGGIAGNSRGYIRECDSKCVLTGDSYIGGIAGEAEIVTDCRAVTKLTGGNEKIGGIIGYSQEHTEMSKNYYRAAENDIGAIDGISYKGRAQSLAKDEFSQLENLNDIFRTVTVEFVFEDGTTQPVTVETGDSLAMQDVPLIPEKSGYTSEWDSLDESKLQNIEFDAVYYAVYIPRSTIVQSEQKRENGLPVVLVQGTFEGGENIALTDITSVVSVSDKQAVIEAWSFILEEGSAAEKIRFLPEKEYKAEEIAVFAGKGDEWRETEFKVIGSYVVIDVEPTDTEFCIAEALPDYISFIKIGISVACVVIFVIVLLIRKAIKKRKTKE